MLVPALCKKAFLQFEALISSNGEVALFSKKKLGKVEVLIVQDSPKLGFISRQEIGFGYSVAEAAGRLKNNKIRIKGYKSYRNLHLSTRIKSVVTSLSCAVE